MGTSTIRALILALAVAVGGLLIAKGFSGNTSQAIQPPSKPSPTPSHAAVTPPPTSQPQNPAKGVKIQILNGTTTIGFAAQEAKRLKKAGYKIDGIGTAVAYTRTTIFYKPGQKSAALYMKQKFYPSAAVKPSPSSITANVQLTVILGADLAATPSPTPSASG